MVMARSVSFAGTPASTQESTYSTACVPRVSPGTYTKASVPKAIVTPIWYARFNRSTNTACIPGMPRVARGAFRKVRPDQHHVILFRQLQIFVGHHFAVLDGIDARFGGVMGAGASPAMRGNFQSIAMRLFHHEADVVGAVNIFLIVDHNFNHRRAIMNVFANRFDHFVMRIGESIFRRGKVALFGLQMKLPAIGRNDASRVEHCRAGYKASLDGFA